MAGIYDGLASIGSGVAGIGNAVSSWASYKASKANAQAIYAASEYQRRQFIRNAELAGLQAESAVNRGTQEANKVRALGRRVVSSQRAAFAASGIEVDSGTALDLQAESIGLAAQDAEVVKTNAYREAWGHRLEASNLTGQAAITAATGKVNAANTLLTGGLGALNQSIAGIGNTINAYKYGAGDYFKPGPVAAAPTTYGVNTRSYDAYRATV